MKKKNHTIYRYLIPWLYVGINIVIYEFPAAVILFARPRRKPYRCTSVIYQNNVSRLQHNILPLTLLCARDAAYFRNILERDIIFFLFFFLYSPWMCTP